MKVDVVIKDNMTFIDLFSFLGGLAGGLRVVFRQISKELSDNITKSKLIRKLYIFRHSDFLAFHLNSISNKTTWVFKKFDKYKHTFLIRRLGRWCCKRPKSESQKLRVKAMRKLEKDFDIVRIVDTIHKIKATLKVVI